MIYDTRVKSWKKTLIATDSLLLAQALTRISLTYGAVRLWMLEPPYCFSYRDLGSGHLYLSVCVDDMSEEHDALSVSLFCGHIDLLSQCLACGRW